MAKKPANPIDLGYIDSALVVSVVPKESAALGRKRARAGASAKVYVIPMDVVQQFALTAPDLTTVTTFLQTYAALPSAMKVDAAVIKGIVHVLDAG
jgi:hypothetical protein